MKKHGHIHKEFDAYYLARTPANAVRLARADHLAGGTVDHEFTHSLAVAARQLEAYEAIIASLQEQPACKPGTPVSPYATKLTAIREKAEKCKTDMANMFETNMFADDLLDEIIELTR